MEFEKNKTDKRDGRNALRHDDDFYGYDKKAAVKKDKKRSRRDDIRAKRDNYDFFAA